MQKKKREKAEDFIGWKSDDGLLEAVSIHGTKATFKVICNKCKEDTELFPLGYFISQKSHLIVGRKPCGCSKSPKWNKEQHLILARRAAKGRFIVHNFVEEYKGVKTKLNLECLMDGHKWIASVDSVINNGYGCPKCSNKYKPTEQEAFDRCKSICETEYYESLGFPDGYKNIHSRFEYSCKKHGKQNVNYGNFVNRGTRCKGCWKERQKEITRDTGNRNGYYPERKNEQDFLYILDFDSQFIKVGRSFDVDNRITNLKSVSSIKKIHKLRIFTATHQEIYDLEQDLHSELRERNFQHYVDWSTECFTSDSLPFLNMLLDKCGLEEVKL